ncbi:MAG: PKD domain-containing protein, partial [Candidatus Bipolaricaulis sp.]|nr:PKD domain-containing protein [Candidatus Bipolaricaulis sp.]
VFVDTSTKTWITAGVSFTAADFTPDLPEVPDDRDITVTVTMRVKSADAMTSSGNNKTIRPRTTVNVREGEAGSQQSYTQRAVSTRIQRVRYQGFEVNEEISTALVSGVLTVGEYLTQTIRLTDDDVNGNDLELGSIEVRNTGTATGDEFSRIEVLRGGVLIGAIDDPENFAAGETFNLSLGDQVNDRGVRDNRSATLTILYHIGNGAVSGHTLKPRVRVDVLEQNVGDPRQHYWSDDVTYPNTVSLYGPGFEVVKRDPDGPAGGDAYTGQRLLAQQILCRDIDENADDVTINPIVVKNLGTASGNPDIVKIEITDSEGRVLGEATDLTGFTSGGVSISTFVNNVVHDSPEGGLVVLLVYLTVADPEEAKTGRTINLETRILHTESGMGYEKQATGPTWTIRLNHRPVADFSHVPNIGNVREEMTFTAGVADADKDAIVSYEWTFGNGRGSGTSTEKDPKYAFPAGGRYEVTLTATDARGLSGTVTKDVVVNFAPTAGLTWEPEAPDIGVQVQFTSTVSDPDDPDDSPYTYEWDFGDDTISADANPVHSFAERRTYDVSLTVTDARGGQTTVTAELTAGNRAPVVDFTWSPTAPDENEVVTFSATVSDPDDPDDTPFTYAWTFGSIGTSTAAAPTQAFPEKKSYEVTLVVTDSRRGRTTVSKTLSVGNTPPVIGTLEADPMDPVAGETVQFAATATDADADTIEAFTWSFGDGPRGIETISGTTSHAYMTAGTYTVSVTATDSRGGVSEAKTLAIVVTGPEQIAVRAYPNPAKTQATLNYYLPNGATDPVLRVYRLDGKLVFEANLDEETAAYIWDLVADDDEKVANGLYFCVVTATDEDGKTIRSEVFRLLVTQ